MQRMGIQKDFAKLVKKIELCKDRIDGNRTRKRLQRVNKPMQRLLCNIKTGEALALAGGEVVVEDYSGGYFVDEFLVATCHATKTTVDHSTMSEGGSETLVVTFHRHIGHLTTKLLKKRVNIAGTF